MIRSAFSGLSLPEEDIEGFSDWELFTRKFITRLYRFLLGSFVAWQAFDFMFNPIWMHGYVWSLNLPIEMDMADKSAGLIVDHQYKEMGEFERILYAFLSVISIYATLWRAGFASQMLRVWHLFRLAFSVGTVVMFVRWLQIKQRLYSAIHEAFYTAFIFVLVGVALCMRFDQKIKKKEVKKVESKKEEIPKESFRDAEESKIDSEKNEGKRTNNNTQEKMTDCDHPEASESEAEYELIDNSKHE